MLRVSTRYGSCATTTRTGPAAAWVLTIVDPGEASPLADLYDARLGLELDVAEQGAPLTLAMVFRSADGWRHGGPWPF